jgi:hypothetical protein
VLIPTHNKPTTLPLTVDTVLRQRVTDLEVVIIGDNVTDDVRRVVRELQERDGRVRFLDLPKAPQEGEAHRHEAVMGARSEAIFYLCDDDLLLPDHVGDLLELLERHNFVQSLNGYVTPQGEVRHYPNDLSNPAHVAFHLRDDVHFNAVSITGTAHSKSFYEEVGDGWETTPEGEWTDRHQWSKMLRHPSFRGATSARMTALQFPTSTGGRATWTQEGRVAELQPWHELVTGVDGQETIDALAARGALAQLAEQHHELVLAQRHNTWLESSLDDANADLEWLKEHHQRTETALAEVTEWKELNQGRLENAVRRARMSELQVAELQAKLDEARARDRAHGKPKAGPGKKGSRQPRPVPTRAPKP